MQNATLIVALLISSNIFMTFAWYKQLKFNTSSLGLFYIILISLSIVFFKYCLQKMPTGSIGFRSNGGSFDLWQLKVMQEVITLVVYFIFKK